MSQDDISRDPKDYHPTVHAVQRVKNRGIEWPDVSETIQEGQIVDSHKDGCKLFIRPYESEEQQLKVIANVETGDIITATWIELR